MGVKAFFREKVKAKRDEFDEARLQRSIEDSAYAYARKKKGRAMARKAGLKRAEMDLKREYSLSKGSSKRSQLGDISEGLIGFSSVIAPSSVNPWEKSRKRKKRR